MRAVLFSLFRILVLAIQMAGLLAFFSQYLGWNAVGALLISLLLALFLPLVGTILGFIGAIKVWLWPWWLALLVFLPGLALSLAALVGVGTAGILSALLLRKRLKGMGQGGMGGGFSGGFGRAGQRGPWSQGPQAGQEPFPQSRGDTIEGEVLSSRVDKDARD